MIQVDDPTVREGLPLKKEKWDEYKEWCAKAYRLSVSSGNSEVQISTHFCYSEFENVMDLIDNMDADLILIENSRSDQKMVKSLVQNE